LKSSRILVARSFGWTFRNGPEVSESGIVIVTVATFFGKVDTRVAGPEGIEPPTRGWEVPG